MRKKGVKSKESGIISWVLSPYGSLNTLHMGLHIQCGALKSIFNLAKLIWETARSSRIPRLESDPSSWKTASPPTPADPHLSCVVRRIRHSYLGQYPSSDLELGFNASSVRFHPLHSLRRSALVLRRRYQWSHKLATSDRPHLDPKWKLAPVPYQ